jgi:hypothetical protein
VRDQSAQQFRPRAYKECGTLGREGKTALLIVDQEIGPHKRVHNRGKATFCGACLRPLTPLRTRKLRVSLPDTLTTPMTLSLD